MWNKSNTMLLHWRTERHTWRDLFRNKVPRFSVLSALHIQPVSFGCIQSFSVYQTSPACACNPDTDCSSEINLVYTSVYQAESFKFKGTVQPQNQKYIFFLRPSMLFIHWDCFGVSCRVLEIVETDRLYYFLQIHTDSEFEAYNMFQKKSWDRGTFTTAIHHILFGNWGH